MRLKLLYIGFVFNIIITGIYMVLDLINIKILNKLDFTLLLVYDIVTLVILTEFAFKEKNRKIGNSDKS